ncbi:MULTISPECIES: hypothetical protein [unclassified Ekhidna]|uniref:hypothetical protein n=1 Tax=unclassified Ekhidna TaxID=2632188 RepID=UPI0032DFC00C
MKCSSGKRAFDSVALAEEALIQHHIRNDYKKGEGPINIYECKECGNWHFTSKGIEHELFNDQEIVRRIESERRAFLWEQKLR